MNRPEVVLRRVSEAGAGLERCRDLLSDAERTEMNRFLRAEDRDRFALARATLREGAGARLGLAPQSLVVVRDGLGKPTLPQAPHLGFNVSHSVDLDALASWFMTPAERAAFARAHGPERARAFFRQWCFKEALVKAVGTGLTRAPKRFEILFEEDAPRLAFVGQGEDDLGGGWGLAALDVAEGYSGALVWR